MNNEDEKEKIEAEKQWSENANKYLEIFKEIKKRLPKKFLDVFIKKHGFHDYKVKSINIIHSDYGIRNPIEINITISGQKNLWKLT